MVHAVNRPHVEMLVLAVAFHVEGLQEAGLAVPEPSSRVIQVAIGA